MKKVRKRLFLLQDKWSRETPRKMKVQCPEEISRYWRESLANRQTIYTTT